MASDQKVPTNSILSALKEAQQRVVQEERLLALSQMAAGMAHDLNNALTPIVGFSDYLMESPTMPDQLKKYLQHIRTAAGDIAQTIEQVRQFYRRRDASEPLPLTDLNRLALEVIENTRSRWNDAPIKRGFVIRLVTELEDNLPLIQEHEGEVRDALTHLIQNAVDAMGAGGTLTVVTRSIAPARETPDEISHKVLLEVRDTGSGMDDYTRQHCLEPFFTTKGTHGNGLGLAMVYGLMRRHRGSIELSSELNQGTSVRLLFNAGSTSFGPPESRATSVPLPPLRILCIDHDGRISTTLQDVFTCQNHLVHATGDTETAVRAFHQARQRGEPFQVVVTQLASAKIDGRQIARAVKLESPDTPVIMLTGWSVIMDSEEALSGVESSVGRPSSDTPLQFTNG